MLRHSGDCLTKTPRWTQLPASYALLQKRLMGPLKHCLSYLRLPGSTLWFVFFYYSFRKPQVHGYFLVVKCKQYKVPCTINRLPSWACPKAHYWCSAILNILLGNIFYILQYAGYKYTYIYIHTAYIKQCAYICLCIHTTHIYTTYLIYVHIQHIHT